MAIITLNSSTEHIKRAWANTIRKRQRFELRQAIKHLLEGTTPPPKFDYSELYISPDAAKAIKEWDQDEQNTLRDSGN